LGFIRDDRTLAAAYQAADTFVCPSIEDSGPMMINESLMCGTPVVSFDMGVAGDLVHTGTTGYRARLGDCRDLARGIGAILALSPDQRDAVARECRQLALRLCHPGVQARAVAAISETAIQHHAER
jgi:glycosyltransferase involved in cell wall biosynthesis